MRRSHLGPVLHGGGRLLLARILFALLRVPITARPAAVVFSARESGLLQGRLYQVSALNRCLCVNILSNIPVYSNMEVIVYM